MYVVLITMLLDFIVWVKLCRLLIYFDKFIKLIYKSWTKRDNYVIIKLKIGRGDKSGTIDCNACL